MLEGMLAISECRRLSFEEVKTLLMLEMEIVGYKKEEEEKKSYHWSVIREVVLNDANYEAQQLFKANYLELSVDAKKAVKEAVSCLYRK